MQSYYTTQTWGYKILSPRHISFYHLLLHRIPPQMLSEQIAEITMIEKQTDGSILIHLSLEEKAEEVVKKLLTFFNDASCRFFDTPRYYYKIPPNVRQSLLSWALAFEGCLALLLLSDKATSPFFTNQWEYVNASTGGIYLRPFTLLLYEDYPKIVHPITLGNFTARKRIEQTAAVLIRKMFRRITQAQKGLEGIALLSMVKEKTHLSQTSITKIINDKSFQVKAPHYSPFFTSL